MLQNYNPSRQSLQLNIIDHHYSETNPPNQQAVSSPQNQPSVRNTFFLHKPSSKTTNAQQGQPNYKGVLRAHYRTCSNCPPVKLECRVLQSVNEQNSIKLQISPCVDKILRQQKQFNSANETKNIAKNYGKAIVGFIRKNKKIFKAVCSQSKVSYRFVLQVLPQIKSMLSTIAGFRKAWTDYKYADCLRRVSNIFLRKYALPYLMTSKIQNIKSHIKYRSKFLEGLKNPYKFNHIKDY